jgi:hypothetical protein
MTPTTPGPGPNSASAWPQAPSTPSTSSPQNRGRRPSHINVSQAQTRSRGYSSSNLIHVMTPGGSRFGLPLAQTQMLQGIYGPEGITIPLDMSYFGRALPRAWDVLENPRIRAQSMRGGGAFNVNMNQQQGIGGDGSPGQRKEKRRSRLGGFFGSGSGTSNANGNGNPHTPMTANYDSSDSPQAKMSDGGAPFEGSAGIGGIGIDVLKGCERVVVIGVHGWFPGTLIKTVLGEVGISVLVFVLLAFSFSSFSFSFAFAFVPSLSFSLPLPYHLAYLTFFRLRTFSGVQWACTSCPFISSFIPFLVLPQSAN